jgi:antitoxin component of RelBE/YafQ-DinJ toxin-antitoxin module
MPFVRLFSGNVRDRQEFGLLTEFRPHLFLLRSEMKSNFTSLVLTVAILALAVSSARRGRVTERSVMLPDISRAPDPVEAPDPNDPIVIVRNRDAAIAGLLAALRGGDRIGDGNAAANLVLKAMGSGHPEEFRVLLEAIADATDIPADVRLESLVAVTNFMISSNAREDVLPLVDDIASRFDATRQLPLLSCRAVIESARIQPQTVVEWVHRHPAQLLTPETEPVRRALLASVARKDPALAFSFLPSLQIGDLAAAVAEIAASVTSPEGRTAVLQQARRLMGGLPAGSSSRMEESVLGALGSGLNGGHNAAGEPLEASRPFEEQLGWLNGAGLDDRQIRLLLAGLEGSRQSSDNARWLSWLGGRAEPVDPKPVNAIMGRWAGNDPAAAEQWILASAPGPVRNAAIRVFAERTAQTQPEAAARVAMLLLPGPQRDELVERLGISHGTSK